jgi:hypothetical protein
MATTLMSVEQECLTVVRNAPPGVGFLEVVARFLHALSRQAPSLPGSSGLFNPYGRVYLDGHHLEFAAAECSSPYDVPWLLERQQQLAALVTAELRHQGIDLLLAANNHSGALEPGASTWGTHENYLVRKPPADLADLLLPFLVTRIYAGSGGVVAATGEYVASVRLCFLETDVGGGTVSRRALFSLARNESHLPPRSGLERCHLILGDGHRSWFSWALHLGTTALVLHVLERQPALVRTLPRLPSLSQARFWLQAAATYNRLAKPGQPLSVHPLALEVQRYYLDLVRRGLDADIPWANRLLNDWQTVLDRIQANDTDWLQARLDPWIKFHLLSSWLESQGATWEEVARRPTLRSGLVLLQQSYHDFTSPENLFAQWEASSDAAHRYEVQGWQDPHPPALGTRADARARFLRAHADEPLMMDWTSVEDASQGRTWLLLDPFAREYTQQSSRS